MEARTVYDLVLAAIILLIAFRGWRQGLLSEILRLAGWVAAAVLVTRYAGVWAEQIYHTVLEPRTVAKVAAAIPAGAGAAMGNVAAAMQTIQNVLNSMGGVLGGQIITPETAGAILNMAGQDAAGLARAICATVLQPVLVSLVQMVLGALILIGCLIVARFFARLFASGKRRDSILSMTNRLLGLALGFGEGLVTGWAFVFLLDVVTLFVSTSWLNQQILHNTYLVRLFL